MRRLQIHTNVNAPAGAYIYGRARNNPGDDTGTRVDEELLGDLLQFVERLMALSGVSANDLPDNNTNGFQIYEALAATIASSVASLLDLKGNINASTNPNYPAGVVGDSYYITVAGKVGGASGKVVEIGDLVICKTDNAGGTEASVGTSWFVMQANIFAASETVAGIAEIATQAETNAGSDDLRFVTPLKLATKIGAASESASGVAEIATQAETNTETDDLRIVTPLKLAAWMGKAWSDPGVSYGADWSATTTANVLKKVGGRVYMRGEFSHATTPPNCGDAVLTLPAGYRPAIQLRFPAGPSNINGGSVFVDVATNGVVTILEMGKTVGTGCTNMTVHINITFDIV